MENTDLEPSAFRSISNNRKENHHQTKVVKVENNGDFRGLSRAVSFLLFNYDFPCMQSNI